MKIKSPANLFKPKNQLKSLVVFCWVLLFSFVVIVRPVLPFVEYALRKEFISKNLCKNRDLPELKCEGKCYFMEQIKKSREAAPNQDSPNNVGLSFSDCYFINNNTLSGLFVGTKLHKSSEYTLIDFYQSISLESLVPPPQA